MLYRAFWSSMYLRALTLLKISILVGLILFEFFAPGLIAQAGLSAQIVTLILYYIGITFVFNFLKGVFMSYYLRRHELSSSYRDSFTIVLRRASSLLAHLVFFIVALHVFGVRLGEFVTALSLFAVALVILFTEHWNKFFNGILVLFSKDFQVDDFIRVGDVEGRIRDIGFLHVELHTRAGDVVYVPNSVILNKEILNYSKKHTRSVEVRLRVPADTRRQVRSLVHKLRNSLFKNFDDVNQESFFYTLDDVSSSEVTLVLEFQILTPEWSREREISRFLALEAIDF